MFDIDKVYGFMFGLDKTKLYNTDSIESVMRQDEDYIAKLTATYPNISVKKLINMYLAEEEWVDISNEEINTDIKEFKLIDDFIKENVSKIKINKVSLDFSMESKQGRDNLLLEIMMSFYKHPDVTAKVFKGSDFEYLKGLAKEIGKTPVSRTVIDPIAQVDTSIKYILGKALIGPFTNLNTVLALMQQHNIYTNYPLFFENELGELIEYKDISEIDNTYNILENWVAAIVDNAKFPLADALNVNWATIDVLLLGLALKVPAKQIHGLLVQPIIVEYVKEYERLGGNSEKAREAIIKKYDILNDSKIRTYKKGLNNKDIFNLFLNLSDLGQGLTRIVSASKISEEGLGPNFGTLVFRKRMYSELILDYSRPTKKPKKFENVVPYLADRSLPHYHFNQVLVKSLNFLKDELNYPNDDTGLYGATINIVEAFKKDLTNNSLTAEEINDLDRNLKTAIMSLYIDNLNPNYFSKIFKEKKKEYAQFNDPIINKFFESFVTEKYENVELTVYKGKSEELKSDMSNFRTFIDLIIDADPEFAKLLGENTFKIDGFNIAPHGYTHLLSSKWYKTFTPELIVNNIFSSDSDLFRGMSDIFIDQYFRNNFRKITFLPIIKDLTVYKGVYGKDTNNLYRWDPTISSYKKIEALGIYSNDKNKPMGKLTYEYDLGSVNLNPSQTNVEIIKDDTDGNVDDYLETMEEPKGLTKSDVDQTQGETDGTIECGKTE